MVVSHKGVKTFNLPVISKHCKSVYISEASIALSLKTCPYVSYQNLCSLIKRHCNTDSAKDKTKNLLDSNQKFLHKPCLNLAVFLTITTHEL